MNNADLFSLGFLKTIGMKVQLVYTVRVRLSGCHTTGSSFASALSSGNRVLFPRRNRLQRHLKPSEVPGSSRWSSDDWVLFHLLSRVNFFCKEIISAGEAELVWCLAFEDTVWSRMGTTSDLFWESFLKSGVSYSCSQGLIVLGGRFMMIFDFHLAICG